MKVILIKDVKNLGKEGDVKEVSEGYARNFLLPQKMAAAATDDAIKEMEIRKEKERKEYLENLEKFRSLSEEISRKKIVIKAKDRNGKLFGRIGAKEIIEAIGAKKANLEEKMIALENPIKKTGAYQIKIQLTPEIKTEIILSVEGEK